jgi:hypothetical protein
MKSRESNYVAKGHHDKARAREASSKKFALMFFFGFGKSALMLAYSCVSVLILYRVHMMVLQSKKAFNNGFSFGSRLRVVSGQTPTRLQPPNQIAHGPG